MGTYDSFNAPGGAFERARRRMMDDAAEEYAERKENKGVDKKK
jgi:hypothetical protein